MLMKKYLIVISGATATGKTALAIKMAQALQCPILSCDSRQFYQEMNIGTAKASIAELKMAKHYFINSLSIQDNYSVGDFEKDGLELLKKIHSRQQYAILAGGSGLFIQALCEGLDHFPAISAPIKEELIELFDTEGIQALQAELQQKDPAYAQQVDLQNPQRLIRALAIIRTHNKPFSSFLSGKKASRPFQIIYINLHVERAQLYARINQRVMQMMDAGLLEEAAGLRPFQQLNSLQTVGYQELFDYFDQKHDLETAVALIQRNTRRYAKRQMTWFRRAHHWKHFSPEEAAEVLAYIRWTVDKNIQLHQYHEEFQAAIQTFYQKNLPDENPIEPTQHHMILAIQAGKVIAFAYRKKNIKTATLPQLHFAPSFIADASLKKFLLHEMNFS